MTRAFLFLCVLVFVVDRVEARGHRSGGQSYRPTYSNDLVYASYPTQVNTNVQQGSPAVQQGSPAVQNVQQKINSTSTAQGVAEIMASLGIVGHWGGNPGFEGCGAGGTPEQAYANCCFSNSGMATVDVGYAKSANGMWYCCRRYR